MHRTDPISVDPPPAKARRPKAAYLYNPTYEVVPTIQPVHTVANPRAK